MGDRLALTVVADWFAIHEHVHGREPRLPFESAYALAVDVLERIEERSRTVPEGAPARLIHKLLLAFENGAAPPALRQMADVFIDAMPCEDAADVLLRAALGV